MSSIPRVAHETTAVLSPDNEDEATVTVEDTESGETESVTVRRIDGGWRVQSPELPEPEELEEARQMLGVFAARADGMRSVTARINNGEIADETAAKQAVEQAMEEAAEEGPEPAEPEPEPAAQPREREEVDEVFSGPGMLRGR